MRHRGHIPSFVTLLLLFGPFVSGAGNPRLSHREFERLVLELSESPGSFDTDNLVSNESSYLHVLPQVRQLVRSAEAYVGVGPDQNFTYIVHLRPKIAVIVDIRRDNLLFHLYAKEIFRASDNRWEYLSYLFGKRIPHGFQPDLKADARVLVSDLTSFGSDREFFEKNFQKFYSSLERQFPNVVQEGDRAAFYKIASAFFEQNLQLKYHSHGRLPRPYYPSYQQLMTETDLEGQLGHFLNAEEAFHFLKRMQSENRIVPVVGDFGGEHALKNVGRYLKKTGYSLSAFYVSNVEFYLFRNGAFANFLENVKNLPIDGQSIFIRSYFSYWREHPETAPGYYVTSLVQHIGRFLDLAEKSPYFDYWDMVTRDYVPTMTFSLQPARH